MLERQKFTPTEEPQLAQPIKTGKLKSRFAAAGAALSIAPLAAFGSDIGVVNKICNPKNAERVPGYVKDYYVAKKIPPGGVFDWTSNFGCSEGDKDREDNCNATHEKQIPVCNEPGKKALRGRACEEELDWYSANATQFLTKKELGYNPKTEKFDRKYKLHTKIMATNLKNGKSVVVMPIDWGPGCQTMVRDHATKFDLSLQAFNTIKSEGDGGLIKDPVRVVRVPDNTKLGRVTKDSLPLGWVPSKNWATVSGGVKK